MSHLQKKGFGSAMDRGPLDHVHAIALGSRRRAGASMRMPLESVSLQFGNPAFSRSETRGFPAPPRDGCGFVVRDPTPKRRIPPPS
jgi:hypothetical protein